MRNHESTIGSETHEYRLIYQPSDAFNKMQLMTETKLLLVSTPGCRPQGTFWVRGIQAQNANPGTTSSSLE
jgi:hypothetical protein